MPIVAKDYPQGHIMQFITKTLPRDFNIFLIGDDHEGSLLRFDRGWNAMCDMVNSEYHGLSPSRNRVVYHGDFMECIMVDDYRFDALTTKEAFILRQLQESQRNFEPIKNNIDCFLDSNHLRKIRKFGEVTKYFCEEKLKKPNIFGTIAAHISYFDRKGRLLFKHFATHGHGRITSQAKDLDQALANKKASLKAKLKNKFADTLLNSMGHTHLLLIVPPIRQHYFKREGDAIVSKHTVVKKTDGFLQPDFRWYVNTGCFLQTYILGASGYGEERNYDPIEQGFAVVIVRDGMIQEIKEETID